MKQSAKRRTSPTPRSTCPSSSAPSHIQGRWFYLYLILDIYSRKIVGFEVHDTDSADHAAHLARRTALAEGIHAMPARPGPARRQRRHLEGHHGAGDAALARHQAV